MAREIAAGELCERGVTIELPRLRNPLVEQREGLLRPDPAREAERALHREPQQEVLAAHRATVDSLRFEHGVQTGAVQPPAAFERTLNHFTGASEHASVEIEAALPERRRAADDPRRE